MDNQEIRAALVRYVGLHFDLYTSNHDAEVAEQLVKLGSESLSMKVSTI
jgi:hypothetical protein